MSNFFDRLRGRKNSAASAAKDRLKFVLVTDRTSISPEDMKNMQQEIIEVIKKYCRVTDDAVELKLEQRERDSFLVADIPLAADAERGTSEGSIKMFTSLEHVDDYDDEDYDPDAEPFYREGADDIHSQETQPLLPTETRIQEMKIRDANDTSQAATQQISPPTQTEESGDGASVPDENAAANDEED